MPEVVTVEKMERKTVVQLQCGHWIKVEGTATPRSGRSWFVLSVGSEEIMQQIAQGIVRIVKVWRNRLGWWYRTDCPHREDCWAADEPRIGERVFCSECAKKRKGG